jgi:hypothetical protein
VRNGESENYSEKYEVNNGILLTIVLVFYLLPKKEGGMGYTAS